ncbi:hypothetical protein AVEN_79643-1, partial [Araneus ventricosus]
PWRTVVFSKPIFDSPFGKRKPDLVAEKDKFFIDSQVVGDSVDLKRSNLRKISYYRDNQELDDSIRKQHLATDGNYVGATLNFRGFWSEKSADDLVGRFKVLNRSDLSVISECCSLPMHRSPCSIDPPPGPLRRTHRNSRHATCHQAQFRHRTYWAFIFFINCALHLFCRFENL